MEKTTLRAGIVGSGFAAKFHFEALKRVYSVPVEVVGVYSRSQEKLHEFAAARSIQAFNSLEELIEASDVLHICTPPATHEPIALKVLQNHKHVIIEKPFTGYFGADLEDFSGDDFDKAWGLTKCLESIKRMLDAEHESKGKIMYAENWVYAPAIQKEREIIEKTGAQILWMQAQQAHSGSHSPDYGKWQRSGGGSLIGKGCHPLAACIYLKHVEGQMRDGVPIRPATVSARVHSITRIPGFKNEGCLKDSYTDVEDYASVHLVFDDGTIADIVASELLHGGVKNYVEVHANNHRIICNITPNTAMMTYNPTEENFKDIYVVEKTGTKQGWSFMSPDEAWFNGYQHEMDAFYHSVAFNEPVAANSSLASDVTAVIYTAYVSAQRQGAEVTVPIFY